MKLKLRSALLAFLAPLLPLMGGESSAEAAAKVSPAPLNPAEAIVCAFWDPGLSDFAKWEVSAGKGASAKQGWASVDLNWSGAGQDAGMELKRRLELDCEAYGSLVLSIVLPQGAQLELSAGSDIGELRRQFDGADGKGAKSEYELPLSGARRISSISAKIIPAKPGGATVKWLALRDEEALASWNLRYWELMRKMDLSPYLAKDLAKSSFDPLFGLFIDAAGMEALRERVAADPESLQRFQDFRGKLLKQEAPERRMRDYATSDRRFAMDRDYAAGPLLSPSDAAWCGSVLKDRELMDLAVRRAMALALSPHWGAGLISSMPGSAWEHRCFDECGVALELTLALDLAGGAFSPYAKDLILRNIAEKGLGTINFNAWKYNYIYDCNQLAAFSGARLAAYMAMEKDKWPHVAPYADLAMKELDGSMAKNFQPDGGFFEGSSYFQYTIWGALPAYCVYAKGRGRNFEEALPKELLAAPRFADLLVSTDESFAFIPLNDAYGKHGANIDSIAFLAAIFPESQFVRIFNRTIRKSPLHASFKWAWMMKTRIPKEDPPYPCFAAIESMSSAASVRSLDGKTLKVALLGDAKKATHKHEDAGSFIIELDGETLAMDSDSCSYASPFQRILKKADRHNTLCPASAGAEQSLVSEPLPFKAAGSQRSFHASVDLQKAWESSFSIRKRSIDSDDVRSLRISDSFELKSGAGVKFFWLTPQELELKGNEILIKGSRAQASFLAPQGWSAKVEKLERDGNTPQNRLTLSSGASKGELVLDIKLKLL